MLAFGSPLEISVAVARTSQSPFPLAAKQMNRIRKRFRIFAGTKLKDKNVKYNFFQTIKDGNPQSGLPISLIFKERNYAYFTEYFIHTPQQRFTV